MSKKKFKIVIDYSNGVASTIFPMVLGSFDCQVVTLNAHLDPTKLTRDLAEIDYSAQQLAHIVTSLRYDMGCLIDAGGEELLIVDEKGELVDSDRLLSIVTALFLDTNSGTEAIAVPITSTGEVDLIAQERGVRVVKTLNSRLAMMDAAGTPGVRFIGGTKGGFIFTDFFFATDAMYSVAKMLEMMARTGKGLGDYHAGLPSLHGVRRGVNCSWEHKGKVMRNIMHATEGY